MFLLLSAQAQGTVPGTNQGQETQVELTGRTLRSAGTGAGAWERTFAASMGNLTAPVANGGLTYLGAGAAVYAFDRAGNVVGRADLPGLISALDADGGALHATIQGDGYAERFTLGDPSADLSLPLLERAVMPPIPAVTEWLAHFADSVPAGELEQAAQAYPANPFLALRLAQVQQEQGQDYLALSTVRRALEGQMPFPAWTLLARRLDAAGFPAAADFALERARRDAAARGVDPEIPVSRAALGAYGNPSGYVGTLLAQNRLERAESWMRFLRELYPRFEGHEALYTRYADLLEAQGRIGEAEEWRRFSLSLRAGTLYNLGEQDTALIRHAVQSSAAALLLALLAALLTLGARAWKMQGQDLQPYGGRWRSLTRRPLARLRLGMLSYTHLSERLMLVTLAATLFTLLSAWQWTNQTAQALHAPALNMGTYGGGWYSSQLDDLSLRANPDTALLTGLAAQLDNDSTAARVAYAQAGSSACAVNNLGVISASSDDEPQALESYRAALALRPDLQAAQYNLGLNPGFAAGAFQRKYRPGEGRLCYPDHRQLARMVSGDLSTVLRRNLQQPLAPLEAQARASRLDWAVLVTLLGTLVLGLWLLIPRTASATRLGRPAGYRLLAGLLPGSALLRSPWGGVLLVTWAGLVVALLRPLWSQVWAGELPLAGSTSLSLPQRTLLVGLLATYLLNMVSLSFAEAGYWRKQRRK